MNQIHGLRALVVGSVYQGAGATLQRSEAEADRFTIQEMVEKVSTHVMATWQTILKLLMVVLKLKLSPPVAAVKPWDLGAWVWGIQLLPRETTSQKWSLGLQGQQGLQSGHGLPQLPWSWWPKVKAAPAAPAAVVKWVQVEECPGFIG